MNKERLIKNFYELVQIDSESKKEAAVANYIKDKFSKYPCKIFMDEAHRTTNGECGNLIIKIDNYMKDKDVVMLSAHMDTVKPGKNIQPVTKDGKIYSLGPTILGADDKSGIAQIIECMEIIFEQKIPHSGFDLVFTISEEIGLLGAKNLNYDFVTADKGFILDGGPIGDINNQAPAQNSLNVNIFGKAAHASVPERGINSIKIASEIISKIPMGKIDFETTANIGVINGGIESNIVPEETEIVGELRSHNDSKLEYNTKKTLQVIEEVVRNYHITIDGERFCASSKENVERVFDSFFIERSNDLIKKAEYGAHEINRTSEVIKTTGGSDANLFNKNGIEAIVLGTGMSKVHTKEECILVKDLVDGVRWLKKIVL